MTQLVSDNLLASHPALSQLSPARLEQLSAQLHERSFGIGQPLCHRELVPKEVLLILEGEARVLVQEHGRTVTLTKLGPGDWVGLASFLRVKGCEEVAAASDLAIGAAPWRSGRPMLRIAKQKAKSSAVNVAARRPQAMPTAS